MNGVARRATASVIAHPRATGRGAAHAACACSSSVARRLAVMTAGLEGSRLTTGRVSRAWPSRPPSSCSSSSIAVGVGPRGARLFLSPAASFRPLHSSSPRMHQEEEEGTGPARGDPRQPQHEGTKGPEDDGASVSAGGLRLEPGAAMVPHPQKRDKGGEDAYFVSDDGQVLGVADGVGGWAQSGVDPGLYSKRLMAEAKKAVETDKTKGVRPARATDIIQKAYDRTTDLIGSSTAVVLVAEGGVLKYANLGDSGFMVIRGNKVAFRTREQTHAFNTPLQIGTGGDLPTDAEEGKVELEEGDVIVVGTDGLFDNLFDHEIVDLVAKGLEEKRKPKEVAELLASRAHQVGAKVTGKTPFGQSARKHGYHFVGGKMDDITVLVAFVARSSEATSSSPSLRKAKI